MAAARARRRLAEYGGSVASLVLLWWILSSAVTGELLPGPGVTLAAMVDEFRRGALVKHATATVRRVLGSFGLSMLTGVGIGVAMGARPVVDRLLNPWLIVGLAVPRIVLIVTCYLLLGLNDRAAVLAIALAVVPTVVAQVREGTRAIDSRLIDMARAFRRTPWIIGRQVVLPQLLPYLVGTARGALSLAWKMVVFAELMGRTEGIGYQISFYFQMFNMRGILVYALAMVLVMAAIDLGPMRSLERAAFRWRDPVRLWAAERERGDDPSRGLEQAIRPSGGDAAGGAG